MTNITTAASDRTARPSEWGSTASRLSAFILVAAFLGGCASLPPGSNYPKTVTSALAEPEQTRLGRQFADAARKHPGTSAFRMLAVGVDGFLARVQMINAAERTLDLQYFIFRADETGKLLATAVLRAADRGVRVRLLLDDGETVAGDEQMAALDAHPQVEVRVFNPFAYRGSSMFLRAIEFSFNSSRLDYRMHNKLMVVDNSISLVGGRNVGDQYFQIDPESQFADDDVFAAGPVVKQLSATFDEFWNCALAIPARGLTKGKTSDAALARFRESLAGQPAQIKAGGIDYANRISSGEPLTSMLSGKLPLIWDKGELIGKLMHKPVAAAVAAVQSELLMITPYLIPGDEGMQLFADLRKRNVTVRVLTSSLESSTVLLAQSGYMHYRVPLLEMGVGLYEVRSLLGNSRGSGQTANISRFGNYSLHAKLFVLDRQRLFVGSMNFDQRSMHLNTEIGLIIDSPELAQQAATRFAAMVSPPNAYEVLLQPRGNDRAPQLVWRTQEAGQPVDYDREPARNNAQRLEVKLLSVVAIDKEL